MPLDPRTFQSAALTADVTTGLEFELQQIIQSKDTDALFAKPLIAKMALTDEDFIQDQMRRLRGAFHTKFSGTDWERRIKAEQQRLDAVPLNGNGHGNAHTILELPPAPLPLHLPTEDSAKLAPNDIGRLILRDHTLVVDPAGIVYEYNQRFWERIPDAQLQTYAMQYDSHYHTKASRRAEAAAYVMHSALQPRIPWRCLAPTEVPCKNGVVDVRTGAIRPHRAQDYLEAVIPHDYEPGCIAPTWHRVLYQWFEGDPDLEAKIRALQEFFGYILLPHARYKKALFLYGESDTGKSQVPLTIRALVGYENHCALSTEQMADERKRAPIVGKMVNLLTELPMDAMIQDGGFKQLVSTGDPIGIDPKFKMPFEYVPYCKHVICCNNLPQITDLSRGTFNRLLLIQFNRVIPKEKQDKNLLDTLEGEIHGILCWAIEGARRLIEQNGEFCAIVESAAAVEEYRNEQNPINEFVADECEPDPEGGIPMTEFRLRFKGWADKSYGPRQVGRWLKAAGYKVGYLNDGKTRRAAMGLRWRGLGL